MSTKFIFCWHKKHGNIKTNFMLKFKHKNRFEFENKFYAKVYA